MHTLRRLLVLLVGFGCLAGWPMPALSQAGDIGLIDDFTWESPSFGITTSWSDDWSVNEDASWSTEETDYLQLFSGPVVVEVYVKDASIHESLDDYLEEYLRNDAAYYDDFVLRDVYWSEFGEDDETAAGFAYTYTDRDSGWLSLGEMYPSGDVNVLVMLTAPVDDVQDAFALANEGIVVDELTLFGYIWTEDELPTGDGEALSIDAIFAGEEEVLWVGELYGAEIACSGSWEVDDRFTFVDTDVDVESVSINGSHGTFIATFALAENATLDQVMDVHRDVLQDQFSWDSLDEVDAGSEDGYGAWADFSGDINGEATDMIVEATWYDASASVAVIVQLTASADTFDEEFANLYSQCGIDGYYVFSYYEPA